MNIKKINNKQKKLMLKEMKIFQKDLKKVLIEFQNYFKYVSSLSSCNVKICYCTVKTLVTIYNDIQNKIVALEHGKEVELNEFK